MSRSAQQNNLLTLAVLPEGTIIQPKPPESKTRADVYINIPQQFIHSPDDLVDAILTCEPLVEHVRERSQICALELEHKVKHAGLSRLLTNGAALRASERLVLHALRSDALNGWQSWIESSGDDQLEVFKTMVCDWLPGQIDASVDHAMARGQHAHQARSELRWQLQIPPPVATPYLPRRNGLIMLFQADGDVGDSFLEPGALALKASTAQRS